MKLVPMVSGGQWQGNLAVSKIDDGAIIENDHTDDIPVVFVNPESNLAMGYSDGSCSAKDIMTSNGGWGKEFYLKRSVSESWEIHSKACPGYIVQLVGICQEEAKIQVLPGAVRKVKIQLDDGRNYVNLREVEVYDYNGANVAKGKTATQSSNWDEDDPSASKAVDGDLNTISHTEGDLGKHQLYIKHRTLMHSLIVVADFLFLFRCLVGGGPETKLFGEEGCHI